MSYSEREKSSTSKPKKSNILIIEDNPDHWLIIKTAIQESFELPKTVWVPGIDLALSYLSDTLATGAPLPQVILLDLYLPERQQGWQLLESIKSMPAPINQLPVIVLSHSSDPHDITESYDRGAASFVTKPTDVKTWQAYFQTLTEYWWQVAALPNTRSF